MTYTVSSGTLNPTQLQLLVCEMNYCVSSATLNPTHLHTNGELCHWTNAHADSHVS